MSGRKRSLPESEEGSRGNPKKKRSSKEAKPLDPKKFGGKTEEEVCQMLLPDHMGPGLDIIFMGINPGLYSAYLGHHYCNANNHFWPCLFESGLVPKKLGFREDAEVLKYGIGITNIVPRTTRSANELSRKEIKDWSKVMIERMQELNPLIICFNGKGIYEIFTGCKCTVGLQEEPLPGTNVVVYVMPSTSGRAATYPKRSDKLKFFNELKDLRDRLRREQGVNTATANDVDILAEQVSNTSQTGLATTEQVSSAECSTSESAQYTRPQQVAVIVSPGGCRTGNSSQAVSQVSHSSVTGLTTPALTSSSAGLAASDTSAVKSPYFQ